MEYLLGSARDLTVADRDTFYRVDAADRIDVDLDGVEELLGDDMSLGRFLVVMTSYVGRVDLDDRRFSVSAAVLRLEDDALRDQPQS